MRQRLDAARRKPPEQEYVLEPKLLLELEQARAGCRRLALEACAPERDVLAPLLEEGPHHGPALPPTLLAQIRQHAVAREAPPRRRRRTGLPDRPRLVADVALAQRPARPICGQLHHALVLHVGEPDVDGLQRARPAGLRLLEALGGARA